MVSAALQMVRDDLRHEHRHFVRCVELPCLFARVGSEHADEVLVDEPQHVVVLLAIHGDVFDELDEIADRLKHPRKHVAVDPGAAVLPQGSTYFTFYLVRLALRQQLETQCSQIYKSYKHLLNSYLRILE